MKKTKQPTLYNVLREGVKQDLTNRKVIKEMYVDNRGYEIPEEQAQEILANNAAEKIVNEVVEGLNESFTETLGKILAEGNYAPIQKWIDTNEGKENSTKKFETLSRILLSKLQGN